MALSESLSVDFQPQTLQDVRVAGDAIALGGVERMWWRARESSGMIEMSKKDDEWAVIYGRR